MKIEIQVTAASIPESIPQELDYHTGAWVEFRGIVRGQEGGEQIAALEYEAYSPMAESEMRRILEDIASRQPCARVRIIHRTGIVPVGQAAIYAGIGAKHRVEAFAMLSEFMDRLKADVPIWKIRSLSKLEARPHSNSSCCVADSACSAAHVIHLLNQSCSPLEVERVPVSSSPGRVLRENVIAPEPQPAFDRSSVDGYAVRFDDPGMQFKIVDHVRAGEWRPRELNSGEAVRIATGGAVPSQGLKVVMKEDVRAENGHIEVLEARPGLNIRFRGDDAPAGCELVRSGTILNPGTLGLLASVGYVRPLVTRLPRVLHIATGNEIVAPEQLPAKGQVRDSNSSLVRAFLREWGIDPEQERVGEEEEAIWEVLRDRAKDVDLLLISGGASVGEHDFTRRLLERGGFEILVSKTNARPGKPLIVARRGKTLALGLPGNPLAHFVCLNLYARAALEAWSGQAARSGFEHGVLAQDLEAGGNARETFWPAFWQLQDGAAQISPLRWNNSGDLTSLATANALIRIHSNEAKLLCGTRIEFLPTARKMS